MENYKFNDERDLLINNKRRCGNTTRLVDYYIQWVHNNPGKDIELIDHFDSFESSYIIGSMIQKRIGKESVNYFIGQRNSFQGRICFCFNKGFEEVFIDEYLNIRAKTFEYQMFDKSDIIRIRKLVEDTYIYFKNKS